jgi:type IV pilus assembly protein PilM
MKSAADHGLVVFDFGSVSTLVVHLDVSGKELLLRNFLRISVADAHTLEDRQILFKTQLAPLGLSPALRAVAVWDEGMAFRQIALPDMPADDLRKAIAWELRNKHLVDPEEQFAAWEPVAESELAEGGRERAYTVFSCERKTAIERAQLIQGLGFRIAALVPGPVALASLAARVAGPAAHVLICDVGRKSTRITVAHGGKCVFSRTVQLGGQALTEMMTAPYYVNDRRLTMSAPEAEALKLAEGAGDPQAPHIPLVRPYLDKLMAEIKRSMDYYESQKYSGSISGIAFAGGGADLKGLQGFMAQFLGVEVIPLGPQPADGLSAEKRAAFEASPRVRLGSRRGHGRGRADQPAAEGGAPAARRPADGRFAALRLHPGRDLPGLRDRIAPGAQPHPRHPAEGGRGRVGRDGPR